MSVPKKVMDAIRVEDGNSCNGLSGCVRCYGWIDALPSKELKLTIYACKNRRSKTRELVAKPVAVMYSSKTQSMCRDYGKYNLYHMFSFDFSQEKAGPKRYWSRSPDDDTWNTFDRVGDHSFIPPYTIVNPDGLARTKYAKCGYFSNPVPLDLFQYLDFLKKCPEAEFLQKAGLGRFIKCGFTRRLKRDKPFFNFFRSNAGFLSSSDGRKYGCKCVEIAYKYKCGFEEAEDRRNLPFTSRAFPGIPKELVTLDLMAYLRRNKAGLYEYERYCGYASDCGEDIRAFGMTFPRDFYEALEQMERRSHDARLKKERADNRRTNRRMKAVADKLKKLAGRSGAGLVCVVPEDRLVLVDEGNKMHNCIGSYGYGEKVAKGESIILLLRDGKGNACVDVEIDRRRWKVVQCYAKFNAATSDEQKKFADRLCAEAKRILGKKRSGEAA